MTHQYCHHCGTRFADESWPRTCTACKSITWNNPLPVVVALVPILRGILTIRRAIEPKLGSLALPGGYIDRDETYQQAAHREVLEETGLNILSSQFTLYDVQTSVLTNNILIFCQTPLFGFDIEEVLRNFTPNREVLELVVVSEPRELAFGFHTLMLARILEELYSK